jgi:hypothetical protein
MFVLLAACDLDLALMNDGPANDYWWDGGISVRLARKRQRGNTGLRVR